MKRFAGFREQYQLTTTIARIGLNINKTLLVQNVQGVSHSGLGNLHGIGDLYRRYAITGAHKMIDSRKMGNVQAIRHDPIKFSGSELLNDKQLIKKPEYQLLVTTGIVTAHWLTMD